MSGVPLLSRTKLAEISQHRAAAMFDRAKRWNSARRVRPTYSGVYEFRSTIWPDLTALDFDQRKGWGKFLCLGPTVIFRRYRPRLFDAWRGRLSASIEKLNMQDESPVIEQWLSLSQAPADLVDGWYRIDPDDRFGPYAQYVRGRWLVMLKTGERCELPWSALEKFRFDANDTPAALALPEVDLAGDPR